jgi:hypothetical protein
LSLDTCIRNLEIFVQILAIENLKKRFILELSIYNIVFWLLKASQKKKKEMEK